MSVVTLRPTASVATNLGAVNVAYMADDSDATHQQFTAGEYIRMSMTDTTLPAGAVLKGVSLRARCSALSGGGVLSAQFKDPAVTAEAGGVLMISSPAVNTYYFAAEVLDRFTNALINAGQLQLWDTAGGTVRVHEAYVDVVYVAKPVVVVDAPTGTLTGGNTPKVTWTPTLDTAGGPQVGATVHIFTAAQYGIGGFDPGTSPRTASAVVSGSATSATSATPLPDGTYRAYVSAYQVVNGAAHQSDWAFTPFTVDVDSPNVPTITLVGEPESGRVRVQVVDDDSGVVPAEYSEIERSDDGGVTWVKVRTSSASGSDLFADYVWARDYEAPIGVLLTYRARSLLMYGGWDGPPMSAMSFGRSAWVQATITLTSEQWWLKNPLDPTLNTPITLKSYGAVESAARQGIFQGQGAALPVVVSDTREGDRGQITVRTDTTAERDQLKALVNSNATLLLQGPAGHGEPQRYVRLGNASYARLIDNAHFHVRDVPLAWVEVERPAGSRTGVEYTPPDTTPDPTGGVFGTALFNTATFG